MYKLARSKNIWERRTAIVSTGQLIRQGDVADTFKIAEILVNDEHDLIHKATGWMLRAAGGVDRKKLLSFLDKHAAKMPRTLLRYSLEHLDKKQRVHYLSMKKVGSKPAGKSVDARLNEGQTKAKKRTKAIEETTNDGY